MEYVEQLLHTLQTIEQTKSFLQRRCATGMAGQSLSLFEDLASLLELVKSQYGHTDYIPRYIPMYGHSTDILEALEYLQQVEDWAAEVKRRVSRRRLRRQLANQSPLEVAEAEGKPFVSTAKQMAQMAQIAAPFTKAAQPLPPPPPAPPEERAADSSGVTVEFSAAAQQLTEEQVRALPQSQQVKYFYDLRRREAISQQEDFLEQQAATPYITPVEAAARVADVAERSAVSGAPSGILHSRLQARQAMRETQPEVSIPEPTRSQPPVGASTPVRENAYRTGADVSERTEHATDTRAGVPHRERPIRNRAATSPVPETPPNPRPAGTDSNARPMGADSNARPMGTDSNERPQRPSRARTAVSAAEALPERPRTTFDRTIQPDAAEAENTRAQRPLRERPSRPRPPLPDRTVPPSPLDAPERAVPTRERPAPPERPVPTRERPTPPERPVPTRERPAPQESSPKSLSTDDTPLGPSPQVKMRQGLMWDTDRQFSRLTQQLRQLEPRELSRLLTEKFAQLEPRYQMVIGDTLRKHPHFGAFAPEQRQYEALERRAFHLCAFPAEWSELYQMLGDMRSKTTLYAILDNWFSFNIRDASNMRDKTFLPYLDLDVLGLAENEVLADCGAYTGEVSAAFAKIVEQYQHIFAFEPDPSSFTQLESRLVGFSNVTTVQKAVLDNESGAMLLRSTQPNLNRCDANGTVAVKSTTLDEEITQHITLLKIAVCGSETAVIRGAADHIHKDKPRLAICADYSPDLLWQLPKLLNRICPGYQYYLRHYGGNLVPTQYVLYAVYPQ